MPAERADGGSADDPGSGGNGLGHAGEVGNGESGTGDGTANGGYV
jgi:hypothetical protein